ncbi:MAG: monooxygenase [Deltaproteobacteria bacterium]|nr:monooxygenase [Deltaproteobacteria bacterium]
MLHERLASPLLCLLILPACGESTTEADDAPATETADSGSSETGSPADAALTYWRDAKSILDARCGGCHRPGDIAPFPLQTYEEVSAVAAVLPASIESGTMPPWPPDDTCRAYDHARSLSEADRSTLLAWLDDGAPQGNPDDAPPPVTDSGLSLTPNLTVQMAEPYTPTMEPDDYRCFLVPWTEDATTYITGFQVTPGNREVVHHVIMFNAEADRVPELQALDEAEAGPGYTCFGGAGVQTRWVGSWVPGSGARVLPEGTGVRIEPGSMMVIQMHYNTLSSAPAADQTSFDLQLADSVERPAAAMLLANPGWLTGASPMLIPAGDPDVTHTYDLPASSPLWRAQLTALGVGLGDPFVIHETALHMHYLGVSGGLSVVRGSGEQECMLEIPQWDFGWQGGYRLQQSVIVEPDDALRMRCTWDNSEANQPVVDGEVSEPQDVVWGEGTRDEMCLGVVYVTAP